MAIEQIITIGDAAQRDINLLDRDDFTPPVIAPPAGVGWRLVTVTQTPNTVYYYWERGTGFSSESANFVVGVDETYLVDATGGNVTATLNATPRDGDTVTIKKVDSSGNTVIIDGNGNNVDGAATQTITSQYDSFTLGFDGGQWFIL